MTLNTYNEFDNNNFDLNIDHYGYESCPPNYAFGPSVRNDYVLHYIIEGSGQFTIHDQVTALHAGDIFILPKDVVTYYQADNETPWSYIWVGFSGSKAEGILHQSSLMEKCFATSLANSKILEQMYRLIAYADKKFTESNELEIIGELYKLLAYLIEEFPNQDGREGHNNHKKYMKQALKIIHSQYDTPLQVATIAEKLNLNRSYLYKIFKEETGQSIKDYILMVKMEKSCDLLTKSSLTISQIATSVGFTDPLAFSKVFKKTYQVSPMQYRKLK
ncbi:AraC family transcriptional regulator [Aerococcus agrisoli]|uniref:AraC family transcriptional regulator n=1 Tax=Aerococcus agrisoli TaxID=2487350 RepID=A0A3N4GCC8_9LACT|nr:AraC family transcriptional regulator [Aerococcus agrisoli]RPA59835.1 AraC family transcriptional regulator [Aerococcus agrisoli]